MKPDLPVKMSDCNLLSAEELLKKGLEKGERTLPVKGLKEVTPSGSWIEQTQIKEALETHKQLIGDTRVEKWGVLSHAEWDQERRLARVTESRGGHWTYLGHCVDKHICLYPEEALLLMELNCLELKYCGVPVSLQQAYSLLLSDTIGPLEYKVFSELSRVGYKVLRTTVKTIVESSDEDTAEVEEKEREKNDQEEGNITYDNCQQTEENTAQGAKISKEGDTRDGVAIDGRDNRNDKRDNIQKDGSTIQNENIASNTAQNLNQTGEDKVVVDDSKKDEINDNQNKNDSSELSEKNLSNNKENGAMESNKTQNNYSGGSVEVMVIDEEIQDKEGDSGKKAEATLRNTTDNKQKEGNEEIAIDTDNKQNGGNVEINTAKNDSGQREDWKNNPVVMVEGPSFEMSTIEADHLNISVQQNVPNNINKIQQSLLQSFTKCRSKTKSLSSLQLPDYFQCIPQISGSETVTVAAPEEDFLPRNVFLYKSQYTLKLDEIKSKQRPNNAETPKTDQIVHGQIRDNPIREAIIQQQMFKPFFMPPLVRFMNFNHRFGGVYANPFVHQFPFFPMRHNIPKQTFNRAQADAAEHMKKFDHLQAIRRISFRLRKLQKTGGTKNDAYLVSLKKLIAAYNGRYNENLELSENLTLRNDCKVTETVDLEDDDGPKRKRSRRENETDESDKRRFLDNIKNMAFRLKQLRKSGERCSRNRRALINAIKVFNRKFKMSVDMNSDFEITDAKQIVLDSSSDSDCIINPELTATKAKNVKKRKNNSERSVKIPQATSNNNSLEQNKTTTTDFYALQSSNFSKWLPTIDDWGRAEVTPAAFSRHRLVNSNQDVFVYNYFNGCKDVDFVDWRHLKAHFWDTVQTNAMEAEEIPCEAPPCDIEPLLSPEDCTDLQSALEKVRIIKTHSSEEVPTTLKVAFDVFERDVKNFRKSDVPVPSFRIICLSDQDRIPEVSEVTSLQQPYGDSAPMLVAVVGPTVSYVLITPTDLPIYVKKRFM